MHYSEYWYVDHCNNNIVFKLSFTKCSVSICNTS